MPQTRLAFGLAFVLTFAMRASDVLAWGDQGHQVIGIIAEHYLEPKVRDKVRAMLRQDDSGLTRSHGIAAESTWADKYRDSDRRTAQRRYRATRSWHFIDLELDGPDPDQACFGHPSIGVGAYASTGPAQDCVVDKIGEFAAELKDPRVSHDEKRIALLFLLHFVGDMHQPLHASDDHDQGGNAKFVRAAGSRKGKLHHYWDTEFVRRLGPNPTAIAQSLIEAITAADLREWKRGGAMDWARQSYQESKSHAYGSLPASSADGSYDLPADYVSGAAATVRRQLSRAGVRLAMLLNDSLR